MRYNMKFKEGNTHHEKCVNNCTCGLCCTKIKDFGVTLGKHEILKDVNLHIHCGDLTTIIGLNGAGKSTLLKVILGEIPHTGKLIFMDANNEVAKRPLIGYVPQKLDFDHSSPISVMDLFASARTNIPVWLYHQKKVRQEVLESLRKVEAEHLIDRRLGALSGGELQRVLLALAIDPIPNLLLLDEPVSGIDHNGLQMFYKTVAELRKNYDLSIILVSHDLDLVAQYADRVVFLNNKTVECVGNPEEVFNNKIVIDAFNLGWVNSLSMKKEGIK